jgi:hypothetical protein
MSAKTRAARQQEPPRPTPEELMALAETPPPPREAAKREWRPPLLRYPPGEQPFSRGVNRALR